MEASFFNATKINPVLQNPADVYQVIFPINKLLQNKPQLTILSEKRLSPQ